MIIVLDTNVLIAAFISPSGICHEVFELCVHNHSLALSEFILSEIKEKLYSKFNYSENEITEVIDLLLLKFNVVKIIKGKIDICRDKDDNNILETAVAAKANVIISGDKNLLVLKKYKNISIISPREFYNSEKGIS
ncbi:MAG: putative toxin-antitoxin system toxin component, PIN family [Bacteroidetes bacterium]|nr:putative toxin-antitoxin system toxin component, PIN family [Bacteroidota bacterium]